jgi:outer membrane protein assembly factor BamB
VSEGGSMASAFGSVWVADVASGRLLRLDPRTRAVEARIPLGGAAWIGSAAGSIWALGRDRLLRIDPSNNRVVKSIPSGGAAPGVVLEGAGVVWMAYPQALLRVDLRRNAITRTVPTSRTGFKALGAVSDGRVLYVERGDGRLLRVDARTGKRLSAVRAPFGGWLLGVAGGTVFMAGDSGITAVDAATGRPRWTRDLRAERVNNGTHDGATVWVQATDRATTRDRLWRIDARTGHVTGSLGLPEFGASALVTVGKQVWTMSVGGDLQVALKKG